MPPLASFPLLSRSEFRDACLCFENRVDEFHNAVSRHPSSHGTDPLAADAVTLLGWRDVKVDERDDKTVLRISKSIDVEDKAVPECEEPEETEDEIEIDDDTETLVRRQSPIPKLNVEYDIILSPTYQVPVLYFSLRNPTAASALTGIPGGPEGLDAVYDYLVPSPFKSSLRQVGVMGGISIGNHPISDVPTYFVHPCNTADALRDVAEVNDEPTTETYLLQWLGLVGSCVGLQIPSALLAETGIR